MLSYTPPHQRGFGTQSRFMRAEVRRARSYHFKSQFDQSGARVLRRPGEGKSELPQRPQTVASGAPRRRPFLSAFEALTL